MGSRPGWPSALCLVAGLKVTAAQPRMGRSSLASEEAPGSGFPARGSAAGPRSYFEKQFTGRLSSVTFSKEN